MSNVIDIEQFKKKLKQNEDVSFSEDDFIIDVAIVACYDILDYIYEYGYDVRENSESIYDIVTIVESIKSLMHTIKNKEYPLHDVSKELFTIDDPEKILEEFLQDA